MASYSEFRISSLIEKERIKFEKLIATFKAELLRIGLDYKQTDSVIKLTNNLLREAQSSIDFLFQNTVTQPTKIVNDLLGHGQKVLEQINSHAKRLNFDFFIQFYSPKR